MGAVPPLEPTLHRLISAIKERHELLAGERGKRIDLLDPGATAAQAVAKINEILALLQR